MVGVTKLLVFLLTVKIGNYFEYYFQVPYLKGMKICLMVMTELERGLNFVTSFTNFVPLIIQNTA